MMRRALVSGTAFLVLTGGADAQTQFDEDEFMPPIFLRQAPEDYLPIEVDLERQFGVFGSKEVPNLDDLLDPGNGTGDYFDYGGALPANSAMNMQANANPTSLTNFSLLTPFLQQSASEAASESPSAAELAAQQAAIAEALANPLSYLWLGFIQNDVINYTGDIIDALGEKDVVNNTTLIMPVLSIQLTEKWKTVIRPVIPINSFRTVDNVTLSTSSIPSGPIGVDLTRESGLGDIVLWMALSKQYKPPDIFGFGITTMFDTASEDQLGTGKNSAGPMVLKFKITEKWIYGVVAQHWWSYSGQDTLTIDTNLGPVDVPRSDLSLTDIQPVLRYRVSAKTNIGAAPNWRYNWKTSQLDLPIGFGMDTLINLGPLPLKVGMEAYYFVESSSDFGPEWQFRLFFVPVFPAPKWAQKPLF